MRQHITIDQLNSLSDLGKQRLREWWKPQEGDWIYTSAWVDEKTKNDLVLCMSSPTGLVWQQMLNGALPLLSIGQLIQFLDEHKGENRFWWSDVFRWDYGEVIGYDSYKKIELCDALWAAALEILERKE